MAKKEDESMEKACMKGVKYLWESGVRRLPEKYIFPASDRPISNGLSESSNTTGPTISLPIIDLSLLQTSNRSHGLESIAKACEEHGFFQVKKNISSPSFFFFFYKIKLAKSKIQQDYELYVLWGTLFFMENKNDFFHFPLVNFQDCHF